jgi:hypothetical protein
MVPFEVNCMPGAERSWPGRPGPERPEPERPEPERPGPGGNNYSRKIFYSTRSNVIKLFTAVIYECLRISWSFRHWQALPT